MAVPYGVVWSALSFPLCPELNTGDPFGANAPLPLAGAALRGKGFGFRADLGSAPRQRFATGAFVASHTLAPLLGELSVVRPTEGSPVFSNCHLGKETSHYKSYRRGRPLCRPARHCFIRCSMRAYSLPKSAGADSSLVRWSHEVRSFFAAHSPSVV